MMLHVLTDVFFLTAPRPGDARHVLMFAAPRLTTRIRGGMHAHELSRTHSKNSVGGKHFLSNKWPLDVL